jgi:hypothetical protein
MIGKAFARALSLCVAMALSSCGGGADPAASQPQQAGPQALAAAVQVPPALDATGLMNWAEGVFSGSYFPVHLQNSILGPFVYRGPYPTGNYMGLAGDVIYIMGPSFGASVPVAVGTLGQFTCRALPQNCTSTGSRVTGTVIGKGSPLAGATVTLQDIAGIARSTTTNNSGTYTLDVSNLAPPFVVTASSASGTSTHMVSVGRLGGGLQNARINITPLTTLLSAMLSPTGRATDLVATRDGSVINGSLTVVTSYEVTLLTPSLSDAGLNPIGFDPISAPLDPGDAMTRLLANLTIGTTPTGANFIAPSNAAPCKAAAQLGSCVTYADPGTQTTTNPNVCGSDIATGASIPCDSSLPLNSVPPPIGINPGQAYNFGCSGCVFFGPKDNYAAPPVQPPLPSVITVITTTWFAHFSVTVCSEGQCFSAGAPPTPLTGTPFENKATCDQAAALLASNLSIPGVSYFFSCTQSP